MTRPRYETHVMDCDGEHVMFRVAYTRGDTAIRATAGKTRVIGHVVKYETQVFRGEWMTMDRGTASPEVFVNEEPLTDIDEICLRWMPTSSMMDFENPEWFEHAYHLGALSRILIGEVFRAHFLTEV